MNNKTNNKWMKMITIIVSTVMIASLAACGSTSEYTDSTSPNADNASMIDVDSQKVAAAAYNDVQACYGITDLEANENNGSDDSNKTVNPSAVINEGTVIAGVAMTDSNVIQTRIHSHSSHHSSSHSHSSNRHSSGSSSGKSSGGWFSKKKHNTMNNDSNGSTTNKNKDYYTVSGNGTSEANTSKSLNDKFNIMKGSRSTAKRTNNAPKQQYVNSSDSNTYRNRGYLSDGSMPSYGNYGSYYRNRHHNYWIPTAIGFGLGGYYLGTSHSRSNSTYANDNYSSANNGNATSNPITDGKDQVAYTLASFINETDEKKITEMTDMEGDVKWNKNGSAYTGTLTLSKDDAGKHAVINVPAVTDNTGDKELIASCTVTLPTWDEALNR